MLELKNGQIFVDGAACAKIVPCEGATDTFREIENGAWEWHRHTEVPTDHMRMELVFLGVPDFFMVPSVSYNGNGWGNFPEYVGDRDEDGTPWSWASHRITIPSCTYSENDKVGIALMSKANDNTACSLYAEEDGKHHVVIFPEEEKPRTLQRHYWEGPFQGTMEPRQDFIAIIHAAESDGTQHRYAPLFDFAFRFFGHKLDAPKTAKEFQRLSIAFCQFLFEREKNGFAGFTTGAPWHLGVTSFKKHEHRYQLGWVGQHASMACACIDDYMRTGNKDNLDIGIEAMDSWVRFGVFPNGLLRNIFDTHPTAYLTYDENTVIDPWLYGEDTIETMRGRMNRYAKSGPLPRREDGGLKQYNDACNHGTGAEGFFEAYDLLKKIGIDKPEYLQTALGACDFIVEHQNEDGTFAKSWDDDGTPIAHGGTVGVFFVLPLLTAYRHSGDEKYLNCALRTFDAYYTAFEKDGYTTAGALDTFSIDKESASPLLRSCMRLYEVTGDKKYIACGEKVAWYLSTWMMHFTVEYPEDTLIYKMGFDTFGATTVSTPHNAVDQYALRDVLCFLQLSELTGNPQWKERAHALWCGACQFVSDGTTYFNGRLRPAGGQDEAVFHTRWRRTNLPAFAPVQWLPACMLMF